MERGRRRESSGSSREEIIFQFSSDSPHRVCEPKGKYSICKAREGMMREVTKTFRVFEYNELTDDAKDAAFEAVAGENEYLEFGTVFQG